jgi:hypothetical protein
MSFDGGNNGQRRDSRVARAMMMTEGIEWEPAMSSGGRQAATDNNEAVGEKRRTKMQHATITSRRWQQGGGKILGFGV